MKIPRTEEFHPAVSVLLVWILLSHWSVSQSLISILEIFSLVTNADKLFHKMPCYVIPKLNFCLWWVRSDGPVALSVREQLNQPTDLPQSLWTKPALNEQQVFVKSSCWFTAERNRERCSSSRHALPLLSLSVYRVCGASLWQQMMSTSDEVAGLKRRGGAQSLQ